MANIEVGCRCGKVHGAVLDAAPEIGNRCICYCRDCQAYAHFLGTDGILDAEGGTDIFQMSPAHLAIDNGAKHLACVRLTKDGLMRWYASCCRTPVGNTSAWPRLPFVGLVMAFVKGQKDAFGPIRMYNGNGQKPKAKDMARGVGILVGAAVRGEHQPNPFFGRDGKPTRPPAVLTGEEHAAAYAKIERELAAKGAK